MINKTLSILIPVYNEEKRISLTFSQLNVFFKEYKLFNAEIIFVDDGSSDNTLDMINKYKTACKKRVVSYPKNMGKGHAIKQGMLRATGDYCLMTDADMSTPFSELKKMAKYINANYPVIIGTRKANGSNITKPQPWYRENLGKGYTILANLITGVNVSDFTCGFKLFSKEARDNIFSKAVINRWSYDAEILLLARESNLSIKEVPVIWRNNESSRVKLYRDIWKSFTDLIRIKYYSCKRKTKH